LTSSQATSRIGYCWRKGVKAPNKNESKYQFQDIDAEGKGGDGWPLRLSVHLFHERPSLWNQKQIEEKESD
jgi:hypothetical protein